MPKNTTKSVLKSLLKRKNAPKWAKKKRKRLSDKKRPLSEAERYANFIIVHKLQLSSTVFNELPKRWFSENGITRPKDFSSSNNMLHTINAHTA